MSKASKSGKLAEITLSPTAPPEKLADWIELWALHKSKEGVSLRDVISQLKIGGGVDSVEISVFDEDVDESDDEILEPIAEAAFFELESRLQFCGTKFPFTLSEEILQNSSSNETIIYEFLALLSWLGKDAGPKPGIGAKIFEEVCAKALEGYLGEKAETFVFGFPRRIGPTGFGKAVDYICSEIGEGVSRSESNPQLRKQKDAKLDIVGWKHFKDKAPGKLIAFGQCATGEDWRTKYSELPLPHKWCQAWMKELPYVDPIRMFFVPHRVEKEMWKNASLFGGILFDRCRITEMIKEASTELASSCKEWSEHAKVEAFSA